MKPAILLGTLRGSEALAAAIRRQFDADFIALYEEVANALNTAKIPAIALDAWSTEGLRQRARDEADRRLTKLANRLADSKFAQLADGLNDEQDRAVRTAIFDRMQRDMAEEILLIDLVTRCSNACDLRLVVVQEDFGRDTRTAIQTARRLGVPSLHILHGIPYQTLQGHDVFEADIAAAQGSRARGALIRAGHPEDRVVITGGMEWDQYTTEQTPETKQNAIASLGLDPNRPILGYAATAPHSFSEISHRHPDYADETSRAIIAAFATLQSEHPDWQFVARPHLCDAHGPDRMREWAEAFGVQELNISEGPTCEFLSSLDAIACVQSNIGVEAMLLGIPVVNVAIDAVGGPVFNEGIGSLYRDGDPVIWVREADEIAAALNRAMTDAPTRESWRAARDEKLSEFVYKNDGQSLKRIAALIETMANAPEDYLHPATRHPNLEPCIMHALPADAKSIYVCGENRDWVRDRLTTARPHANIENEQIDNADTIILTDPLPHSANAVEIVRRATEQMNPTANAIVCAHHGHHHDLVMTVESGAWAPPRPHACAANPSNVYSATGLTVILQRCGLHVTEIIGFDVAGERVDVAGNDACYLVAVAESALGKQSAFAQSAAAAQERAAALLKEGEAMFEAGDAMGAARIFAQAAAADPHDPLPHNNLATVMYTLGRYEEAYRHAYAALHRDPTLVSARGNLSIIAEVLGIEPEADRILALWGATSHEPGNSA